jgi:hypothetical protein
MLQRILNMLIGTWLIFSAFAWRHGPRQFANTLLCGILTVAFAVLSLYSRRGLQLGGLVAAWLFVSALLGLNAENLTTWNNALCAIAIFVCSLSVEGSERRRLERTHGRA